MVLKNKKILVTGGAGFIGSHLVELLVDLGAHVTVLDNLSTGSHTNLEKVNNDITFIEGDIRTIQDCVNAALNKDIIFHLAAQISVPESIKNPSECYETNVIGTFNILEAARQKNIKRLVFSSSAAVYGPQNEPNEPCHEESICRPQSPYGHSKLLGELLCKNYWQEYAIETVCLRYFNVFGNRQGPDNSYAAVVTAFKHRMNSNQRITIFGDGLQTRDFISVQEIVEANIRLATSTTKDCAGKVFNIATGKSVSLLELIDELKKEFPDYALEPTFQPARTGDIKHSVADCKRYKKLCSTNLM